MSRLPTPRRPGARLLVSLLLGLLVAGGCTEGTLTGPLDGVDEPVETREVYVRIGDFATWRDTVFEGYAVPTDVSRLLVADSDSLQARGLLRYEEIPDTVVVDSVSMGIEQYEDATIHLALDTVGVQLPDGGFVLRLLGLERRYDDAEVTWERASAGDPWTTPGGDFTRELARRDLTGVADSLIADSLLTLSLGEATDSLLSDWADGGGGAGMALLVEGAGTRLRLTGAELRYRARPAGRDTVLDLTEQPFFQFSPATFIYDPPAPPVGDELRVGGLPAHRFYFSFLPPESVDGVTLRGATVNRADLVFVPDSAPPPFRLDVPTNVSLVRLAVDPFVYGQKTPIGSSVVTRTLGPDSLSTESPLGFDLTDIMANWAASSPDSVERFHFGVRFQPDAQAIGYLQFGSDEDEPALRPYLKLIVTPPADLEVP